MALDQRKYERKHTDVLRDIRPAYVRLADWLKRPAHSAIMFFMAAFLINAYPGFMFAGDFLLALFCLYFMWLVNADRALGFKLPMGSKWRDRRNVGGGKKGEAEGILFLGNVKETREEVWFTNTDARTHVLYLGTTGSGKTEGLKSMVTNALAWGSGFIYIDGKADTDLWSSLSSLCRRFGRDDDLLVLNYMTGNNANTKAPSNTMNPFSSGSSSYLTNMLVSLMPEAEGDNAMWKERAIALMASIMPALTWKRDNQDIPMSIGTIREYLNLPNVIKLSRDETLPPELRTGVRGYLDTLPGYVDAAFDNDGREKPAGPDQPAYDTTTPRQQHGYLSMQFTRALQSLGDEYGYIFDTQAADVDMIDVVLNRRILVVLIPALEKSADETANLGKIVAASLKGMMGSTLGSKVEGESATVIENKPTHSATPFMTVFDEVGYYTAQGMAVMAAQARSLGFCLIYSAQDLPALEKRVKEEARSITANCNIKIFGKLEDPTQTKEFFEKTVGMSMVMESTGFQLQGGRSVGTYYDTMQAGLQLRMRASYDGLKAFKEGEATFAFGEMIFDVNVFYSNPGHAKSMRVTRYMALPPPDDNMVRHADAISRVRDLMVHKTWTAMKADGPAATPIEISTLAETSAAAMKSNLAPIETGMASLIGVYALSNEIPAEEEVPALFDSGTAQGTASSGGGAAPAPVAKPATAQASQPAAQQAPAANPANPPAGNPANPMSFFTAKKPAEDGAPTAQTTPTATAQPPAEPQQPAAQQQAPAGNPTNPPAGNPANPMSFFAKKPGGAPAQAQPPQQPTGIPGLPPGADPAAMEEELRRMIDGLDPQTRKILEDAGKQITQNIAKNNQNNGEGGNDDGSGQQ